MYLQRLQLTNIRSFSELTWELPEGAALPGWHVILGDNGAGKSTFLRAVAAAFIDSNERAALRQDWEEWLRLGCNKGRVNVVFATTTRKISHEAGFKFELLFEDDTGFKDVAILPMNEDETLKRRDWFSASYGAFRRLTGGEDDLSKVDATNPEVARHLSLFGESIALSEGVKWLQRLKFRQLEGHAEGALLGSFLTFINYPGLLPHGVRVLDVTSEAVQLEDANGFKVPIQSLSDGYRSILSMTVELIRQMSICFGPKDLFSSDGVTVVRSGVVLVDEIDAHLHPSWQRTVGFWFQSRFPNVQFIVSTHSPLICHAAVVGSVFKLPDPGANGRGEMLSGVALDRLLYGNILDAYSTGAFGDGGERSEAGQEMLEQLAELNLQELDGSLSEQEKAKQEELRSILATDASTTQPS